MADTVAHRKSASWTLSNCHIEPAYFSNISKFNRNFGSRCTLTTQNSIKLLDGQLVSPSC